MTENSIWMMNVLQFYTGQAIVYLAKCQFDLFHFRIQSIFPIKIMGNSKVGKQKSLEDLSDLFWVNTWLEYILLASKRIYHKDKKKKFQLFKS